MNELILKKLQIGSGEGPITAMLPEAGTTIADSTDALAMDASYLNRVTFCELDGAAKSVTLPAFTNVGDRVKIVLAEDLVASGVLTIDCAGDQTFGSGSYYSFEGASGAETVIQADNDHTILRATGAATNSGAAAGSVIEFLYLGSDKILVSGRGRALGTGSDAWEFND